MAVPYDQGFIPRIAFIMTQFGCSRQQAQNLIDLITDPELEHVSYHAKAIMSGARKIPPPSEQKN